MTHSSTTSQSGARNSALNAEMEEWRARLDTLGAFPDRADLEQSLKSCPDPTSSDARYIKQVLAQPAVGLSSPR